MSSNCIITACKVTASAKWFQLFVIVRFFIVDASSGTSKYKSAIMWDFHDHIYWLILADIGFQSSELGQFWDTGYLLKKKSISGKIIVIIVIIKM